MISRYMLIAYSSHSIYIVYSWMIHGLESSIFIASTDYLCII